MGQALIRALLARGHSVEMLVRPGSENKIPAYVVSYVGDPLNKESYQAHLRSEHTVVQLAGVAHPSPFKKDLFQKIDFVCGRESVLAATQAKVSHFVYVSVAQPSPIMKAYVQARAQVESLLRESGLSVSILRPWYVVGPGRRWPLMLKPLYWIFENQLATRESALRLGLVSLEQIIQSLLFIIENPSPGVRIYESPALKKGAQ